MRFCRQLIFEINFLKNSFRNTIKNQMSNGLVLIWFQTIFKGYQQTILVDKELSMGKYNVMQQLAALLSSVGIR